MFKNNPLLYSVMFECVIPKWVMVVGTWFKNGLISEQEILNFVDYLFEKSIITCNYFNLV